MSQSTLGRKRAKVPSYDGRSAESVLMRNARAKLIKHFNGTPTATQEVLIERAAMLMLHLKRLDAKAIEAGEMPSPAEYRAWTNTLSRLMRALGLEIPGQYEPEPEEDPYWLATSSKSVLVGKPTMSAEEMDRYRIKPKRLEAAE